MAMRREASRVGRMDVRAVGMLLGHTAPFGTWLAETFGEGSLLFDASKGDDLITRLETGIASGQDHLLTP
ncbi:MAG: hypothetical protein Fur005_04660 [Roseiflexaceae bacterium]